MQKSIKQVEYGDASSVTWFGGMKGVDFMIGVAVRGTTFVLGVI